VVPIDPEVPAVPELAELEEDPELPDVADEPEEPAEPELADEPAKPLNPETPVGTHVEPEVAAVNLNLNLS
jgi:hypothetical protein